MKYRKIRIAYLLLFVFLLIGMPAGVWCQSLKQPDVADRKLAEKISNEFDDEEIAYLKRKLTFYFDYDRKSAKVVAYRDERDELISLKHNSTVVLYCTYNEESAVDFTRVLSKNGRKKYVDIKDEYYHQENYFHSGARVRYFELNFPFLGSRYGYELDLTYYDLKYLTSVYFHTDYPIIESIIEFVIPDWLELDLLEYNFEKYSVDVLKSWDEAKKLTRIRYVLRNTPAFADDENKPGISHVYPHILVVAKRANINGHDIKMFESVSDLYQWYRSLVSDMSDDVGVYSGLVDRLVKECKSDLEKIKTIYYWVQDNIRYIAFEDGIAGFQPDDSHSVYNKKYGDCKGMANLCAKMLILAGFDARLTWMGTNHLTYDYSIPSLAVDNHMITTVLYDGERYFLDPTEKFCPFGDYAERIQGRPVMIQDGMNYILDTIPQFSELRNTNTKITHLSIQNEVLKGNTQLSYNGESKPLLLDIFNNRNGATMDKMVEYLLSGGDGNILVSKVSTSDLTSREEAISLSCNVEVGNAVINFGEEVYVDMNFSSRPFESFWMKDRSVDYLHDRKVNYIESVILEIPDSMTVLIPDPVYEEHPNFSFDLSYSVDGNMLNLEKRIKLKTPRMHISDFGLWDNCIDKLNTFYNEQIVLTK